jgi:hypothetical protein
VSEGGIMGKQLVRMFVLLGTQQPIVRPLELLLLYADSISDGYHSADVFPPQRTNYLGRGHQHAAAPMAPLQPCAIAPGAPPAEVRVTV